MKDFKSLSYQKIGFGEKPYAQKFGVAFKEVNMATGEGLSEGLAYGIRSPQA